VVVTGGSRSLGCVGAPRPAAVVVVVVRPITAKKKCDDMRCDVMRCVEIYSQLFYLISSIVSASKEQPGLHQHPLLHTHACTHSQCSNLSLFSPALFRYKTE
jgi:hypothetical protein